MFTNYEKDKEIFSAHSSMETGDGLTTSAVISGILASRKDKTRVLTPKKYKKQLALTEKFEAMSSEERQEYLNKLEKEIKKCKDTIEFFDNSHEEASDEGKQVVVNALKTGAEMGVCSAVLGMTTVPSEKALGASALFGMGGTVAGIYSQLAGNEVKSYVSHKKLDKLMEEWVACNMVENLEKEKQNKKPQTKQQTKQQARIEAYSKKFDSMTQDERLDRLNTLNKNVTECLKKKADLEDMLSDTPKGTSAMLETIKNAGQLGILGVVLGLSAIEPSANKDLALFLSASIGLTSTFVGVSATLDELSIKKILNDKKLIKLTEEAIGYSQAIRRRPKKYREELKILKEKEL